MFDTCNPGQLTDFAFSKYRHPKFPFAASKFDLTWRNPFTLLWLLCFTFGHCFLEPLKKTKNKNKQNPPLILKHTNSFTSNLFLTALHQKKEITDSSKVDGRVTAVAVFTKHFKPYAVHLLCDSSVYTRETWNCYFGSQTCLPFSGSLSWSYLIPFHHAMI